MKILRAYIENFGKISQQEFNFVDGLNKITQENGYGKTTLATFIKAMLYGMKSTTKKSLDENEKKKYTPWQGGGYGGFLDFEVNGNEYRVERFFGKKDTEDVFKLTNLKTGKQSKDYSENLGEELFGLDADSYERSSFIPQKEIDGNISDKLSAKLINIIQGTSNKDSYENAIKIVKEKSQELKKRGNSGKIAEIDAEIAEISERIDSLKSGANSLSEFYEKLNQEDEGIKTLENKKAEISLQVKKYAEIQTVIVNKKYIEEKQAEKNRLEEIIQEQKRILNNQESSLEQVLEIKQRNTEIIMQQAQLKILEQDNIVLNRFNELKNIIKDTELKPEVVDAVIHKEQKINELDTKIEYEKKLAGEKYDKKSTSISLILMPILTILFAVLSFVFIKNIVGNIMFCCTGVLLLLTGILFYKKIKQKNNDARTKSSSVKVDEWVQERDLLAKDVEAFLNVYRDCEIFDKLSFLYGLKSKIAEFNNLKLEIDSKNQRINAISGVLIGLKTQIDEFVGKFNLPKDLDVNKKLDLINQAIIKVEQSKKDLDEICEKLKVFDNQKLENIDIEEKDIQSLQEQEKLIQKEIDLHRDRKLSINQKIYEIKNLTNELDELEENLAEKISIRTELKAEYKILGTVVEYLTIANDNLTAKYKKPMQDSFNKYLKRVLGDNYQDFDVDTELNVSFKEYGQSREMDYLSQGFKGVVNLCVRFALIDSLFEKEKPFVVLDDPFVNLDKQKIENALRVLDELSNEFQIIYFSCHQSRS